MYTVGLDEEGNVILRVGTDYVTTLTMGEDAVIQMIRLWSATLNTASVAINWKD